MWYTGFPIYAYHCRGMCQYDGAIRIEESADIVYVVVILIPYSYC